MCSCEPGGQEVGLKSHETESLMAPVDAVGCLSLRQAEYGTKIALIKGCEFQANRRSKVGSRID